MYGDNELTHSYGKEVDASSGEDNFDPVLASADFKGPLLGTASDCSDCCSSELALCSLLRENIQVICLPRSYVNPADNSVVNGLMCRPLCFVCIQMHYIHYSLLVTAPTSLYTWDSINAGSKPCVNQN